MLPSPKAPPPEGHQIAAVGLDAGGTETRWVAVQCDGRTVARGTGPALSGLVFTPEARQQARAAILELAAAIRVEAAPMGIAAGVTGADEGGAGSAFLQDMLAQAFEVPPARVLVANDLHVACLAAFPARGGILAYSGTGSAACSLAADGGMIRAGGHGYLLDDGGSGYAIARDALRAVLRAEDAVPGAGWPTALGRELASVIGGSGWDHVRAWAYGGGRAGIAQAAPAVARAAEAGDATALAVLVTAGQEIGRLVALLRARLGPLPAVLAGRAGSMHPAILRAAAERCGGSIQLAQADGAAAAGVLALKLARDPAPAD